MFPKQALSTLAVLMVACAQVLGMQRGYECDHQSPAVQTEAEHCHRVVVAENPAVVPCAGDSEQDCGEQNEREPHVPLVVDMKATAAGLAAVSIPAFVAVLMAEIPVHEWVLVQALCENSMLRTPLDTGDESPPAAVQVARCMVMLV